MKTLVALWLCCVPMPELPVPDLEPEEVETVVSKYLVSWGFGSAGKAWETIDSDGKRLCCIGYSVVGKELNSLDVWYTAPTFKDALAKFQSGCYFIHR